MPKLYYLTLGILPQMLGKPVPSSIANATGLQYLDMQGAPFLSIQDDIFQNLTSLSTLMMSSMSYFKQHYPFFF